MVFQVFRSTGILIDQVGKSKAGLPKKIIIFQQQVQYGKFISIFVPVMVFRVFNRPE
jgi:hypothetical protein